MDVTDAHFFQYHAEIGDNVPYPLDAFDRPYDFALQAKAGQSSPSIHGALPYKDIQDDRPCLLFHGQGCFYPGLDGEVLEGLLRCRRGLELRTLGRLRYLLGRFF